MLNYIQKIRRQFVGFKWPVVFKPVLCDMANFAAMAMLENQARRFMRTLYNLPDFFLMIERNPGRFHDLQVGTRAAIAAVTGFEQEKCGHEGKSEKFLPIFHDKNA